MNRILLAAFTAIGSLLLSTSSLAQTFRPGFIVQASGDTIQGLVKYREGNSKHTSCVFKKEGGAEAKEYLPADIIAYGVTNGALFESQEITNAEGLFNAFVEVLVHGKLSLYQYQRSLFLEKEEEGLKPLTVDRNDPSIGGAADGEIRTVTVSPQHLILINSLTLDCPVPDRLMLQVQKQINTSDITAIVMTYNSCAEPQRQSSFKNDRPWLSFEKGVSIGSSFTALEFIHTPELNAASFATTQNFVFGAFFNLSSPKKSQRFSVQLEPMFSTEKHSGHAVYKSLSFTKTSNYTVDLKRLLLPIMVRYTMLSTKKLSPYLSAGLSGGYGFGSRIVGNQEVVYTTNDFRRAETSEGEIGHKVYFSTTAAIGTRLRISQRQQAVLQLRYEHGRYIQDGPSAPGDPNGYLSKNNSVLYLTAAYILK